MPRANSPQTSARVRSIGAAPNVALLQRTLALEVGRRRQLERELVAAQTALEQVQDLLAGTEADARQSRFLALHDPLTSLPNRRFFCERLQQALAAVERPALAMLYLDLDGFKLINDVHGHDVGDTLLKIVAARLARAVRANDVMSRLGGDEFACLIADCLDREQLDHVARKLSDAVSAPLKIGPLTLTVRASIGIALCPADGNSAEALLGSADAAMYRAKRHRTGHEFFEQGSAGTASARPADHRPAGLMTRA